MPSIPNVTRRGAVYQWRRRLPAAVAKRLACSHISVSLRIREQSRARLLAAHLDATAAMIFEQDSAPTFLLTKQQISEILRRDALDYLMRLDRIAAMERRQPDFDVEACRRADITTSWAYRLLAGRGTNASVDDHARAAMTSDGLTVAEILDVDCILNGFRAMGLVPTRPGKIEAHLHAVGAEIHTGNLDVAQNAIYRAKAAALAMTARRWDGVVEDDGEAIAAMLRQEATSITASPATPDIGPSIPVPPAASCKAPAQTANKGDQAPSPPSATALVSGQHPIALLATAFAEEKFESKKWTKETKHQALQTFDLFVSKLRECGADTLEDIEQKHVRLFKDAFRVLAKNYGKSPEDRRRTLAELETIGRALPPEARGLSDATIRRHLSCLQQFFEHLQSGGYPIKPTLQPNLLAPKKSQRNRSKRKAMSSEDVTAIFDLAPFIGCLGWSNKEAFVPGPHVYHRALFFGVMMLHYMGARREEICGLGVADVGYLAGIAYIYIRDNPHRTIKTHASARMLPIHPEVLRLGFLDYLAAIRALGYDRVFPDLHSGTTDSPAGDKLYDEFRIGLIKAIPEEGRRQKVIHSLRKTFGADMKRAKVDIETRADLHGHTGKSTTDEIYVEDAELSVKLEVMMKLKIVTAHLSPQPIKLIPWVEQQKRMPYSGRKPGAARR